MNIAICDIKLLNSLEVNRNIKSFGNLLIFLLTCSFSLPVLINILKEQYRSHSKADVKEMYESNKDDKLIKRWKMIIELEKEMK